MHEALLLQKTYDDGFARLPSVDPAQRERVLRELERLVDGRPAGLVHYLYHRTCWSQANNCYLQDLFADPDIRGRGVGAALIEAVRQAAAGAQQADVAGGRGRGGHQGVPVEVEVVTGDGHRRPGVGADVGGKSSGPPGKPSAPKPASPPAAKGG